MADAAAPYRIKGETGEWEVVVGLEVHAQITATESKLFSGAATAFGAEPNTQVSLPGVGYVVLNEQIPTGDGVHATGLTVNMIHVYLTDPILGTPAGEIVIGAAKSAASL